MSELYDKFIFAMLLEKVHLHARIFILNQVFIFKVIKTRNFVQDLSKVTEEKGIHEAEYCASWNFEYKSKFQLKMEFSLVFKFAKILNLNYFLLPFLLNENACFIHLKIQNSFPTFLLINWGSIMVLGDNKAE